MILSLSYWNLGIAVLVSWIIQVIMSIKPNSLLDIEWVEFKKIFINQANRLFYLGLELLFSWVINNFIFFGFDLSFLTWAVRIHAGFVAITEILIFFTAIISMFRREIGMGKVAIASLAVVITSILIALSI